MKFFCEKSLLSEAISICSRAISLRSTMSIIEGILLKAENNELILCGYNLKTGIKCTIPAEVKKSGSVVLNAKILGDVIRSLPNDSVEVSVNDKFMVTVKCAVSEFNITAQNADDYPELPEVVKEKALTLSEKILKSMISQTIFAVSENENKPIYTGSLIEAYNDAITIVSVDGYRLAVRSEQIEGGVSEENMSFVVPGDALREIEKILSDSDSKINIYPDKKHILFEIGNIVLISRILEGEFLNYKNAIPKDHEIKLEINVKRFIDSIERVSLLINERLKNPVRCTFESDVIKLTCITSIGKAYDECEVIGECETLEIGFNNKYLLDALKACREEKAVIEIKSGLSPLILKPINGENKFTYLVTSCEA